MVNLTGIEIVAEVRGVDMKKKSMGIVILTALLLIIGVVVWLVISGRLVVALKDPSSQYLAIPNVCGSDIVDQYNSATDYKFRDDSAKLPTIDKDGLANIASQIRDKKGYESDPTCQVMLFWAAFDVKDNEAAKRAYDSLQTLRNKRIFSDNNLRTSAGLLEYADIIQRLEVERSQGDVTPKEK